MHGLNAKSPIETTLEPKVSEVMAEEEKTLFPIEVIVLLMDIQPLEQSPIGLVLVTQSTVVVVQDMSCIL